MSNSINRMLFYQALHRSRSIEEGEDFRLMPHIISIWIIKPNIYNDLDNCMHELKMGLHTDDGIYIRTASDKERIIIIELDKLQNYINNLKQIQNTQNNPKLDYFSSWMSFLYQTHQTCHKNVIT